MGRISGLVPSRFLTLLAHLVVVITLFWSRESNILACLPLRFTSEEYEKQDIQLVVALSITLGLFAVELAGFLSGVSMFNSTQSLICILSVWPLFPHDFISITTPYTRQGLVLSPKPEGSGSLTAHHGVEPLDSSSLPTSTSPLYLANFSGICRVVS
ncbi:transmembrane protein 107 isoform X2 [Nycticebus coucang]|uniref:transmembrane protein 107 isoform X2 n=1 Tax=Nycticebus coucang TaxID=9470 RepID=UPI00234E33C5|nr:transmembrane protein 107 isoform X2 [Nycticebus coucang]